MSSFVKIKLTLMADFDFGQSSSAKTKDFLRVPFLFINNDRIKMLPTELRYGLLMLAIKALNVGQTSFFCCRSDLHLSSKTPLNVALKSYFDLQLIEILDDALTVKRRKEKKREEKRRKDCDEKSISEIDANLSPANPPQKAPSADAAKADLGQQTNQVIAKYCELWRAKYNGRVDVSGKAVGQMKTLVRDHGVGRAIQLVEAFFEMNDKFFIQKRHDVFLILTNLPSISHYLATGAQITHTQLSKLDQSQSNMNALDAYKAKLGGKS